MVNAGSAFDAADIVQRDLCAVLIENQNAAARQTIRRRCRHLVFRDDVAGVRIRRTCARVINADG